MKKIILVLSALVFGAGVMSAQDMAQATETYNAGAEALQIGNNESALKHFEAAIKLAEACGAEGADIINNCKGVIPQIQLSIAKDLYNAKDFTKALNQIEVAIAAAKQYGSEDVELEAIGLKPTVLMQAGNRAIKAKDFVSAIANYKDVVALDATNGMAYINLGQALSATGNKAEAEAAWLKAIENGREKDGNKLLSTMHVKEAAALLKAKKYKDAIAAAEKSNSFLENANAMKIAGTACQLLKDNKGAIDYLKKYTEVNPKAKDLNKIFYTIGALAQTMGDNATAIEFYQKVANDPQLGASVLPLLQSLKK